MKKGMTGVGGLSRKVLATLIMAVMPGLGLANEVYMEQVGDDVEVNINQNGSSNVIKGPGVGATDPAYIGGNGNIVNIDQIGVGNTLSLSINDSAGSAAGTGTKVNVYTDGSSNTQTISCGTSLTASCAASEITTTISGNSNITTQTLNSTGKNTSTIDITGSSNTVKHTTAGAQPHTATITVNGLGGVGAGTGNYVEVNQSGLQGRTATVTSSGNNNTVIVNQTN